MRDIFMIGFSLMILAGPAFAYDGPIIDAHVHPKGAQHSFFAKAESLGIKAFVVMGTPNEYRKSGSFGLVRQKAVQKKVLCSPDFVGVHSKEGVENAQETLRRAIEDFKAGKCTGFGELGLAHFDKMKKVPGNEKRQAEVHMHFSSPLLQELFLFADAHAAVMNFHIEPYYEPGGVDQSAKVMRFYKDNCQKYPRAIFVAAHNGMLPPAKLAELFDACPNVVTDIKITLGKASYLFKDLFPVVSSKKGWNPGWVSMITRYPDRFMIGLDWQPGNERHNMNENKYAMVVGFLRDWLDELPAGVLPKIAHENAARIYGF